MQLNFRNHKEIRELFFRSKCKTCQCKITRIDMPKAVSKSSKTIAIDGLTVRLKRQSLSKQYSQKRISINAKSNDPNSNSSLETRFKDFNISTKWKHKVASLLHLLKELSQTLIDLPFLYSRSYTKHKRLLLKRFREISYTRLYQYKIPIIEKGKTAIWRRVVKSRIRSCTRWNKTVAKYYEPNFSSCPDTLFTRLFIDKMLKPKTEQNTLHYIRLGSKR